MLIAPPDLSDPVLSGVNPDRLARWNAARAAGHVSQHKIEQHGTARLFVADAMLQLWSAEMSPVAVAGNKRGLGNARLLNDDRFEAVCRSLDEYTPAQIANAIRAYGRVCRTDPERQKKPHMRKTFEGFLNDVLEVWVTAGEQLARSNHAAAARVDDTREHRAFIAAWSALAPDVQRSIQMQAIANLDQRGERYTPVTSDPAMRAELMRIMRGQHAS
jgi:hypothetical protein